MPTKSNVHTPGRFDIASHMIDQLRARIEKEIGALIRVEDHRTATEVMLTERHPGAYQLAKRLADAGCFMEILIEAGIISRVHFTRDGLYVDLLCTIDGRPWGCSVVFTWSELADARVNPLLESLRRAVDEIFRAADASAA